MPGLGRWHLFPLGRAWAAALLPPPGRCFLSRVPGVSHPSCWSLRWAGASPCPRAALPEPHGHLEPQRDPLSPREAAQGLWSLSQRHPASPRPLPPPPGLISRPVPGSGMNKSAPLHNGDADFHRLAARAPRPHPGGATSVSLVAVPGAQPGSKHPQLGIPSLSLSPPGCPGIRRMSGARWPPRAGQGREGKEVRRSTGGFWQPPSGNRGSIWCLPARGLTAAPDKSARASGRIRAG